jgi:hypothetical protein
MVKIEQILYPLIVKEFLLIASSQKVNSLPSWISTRDVSIKMCLVLSG